MHGLRQSEKIVKASYMHSIQFNSKPRNQNPNLLLCRFRTILSNKQTYARAMCARMHKDRPVLQPPIAGYCNIIAQNAAKEMQITWTE